jgi:GNAT superfamily N-acetyltransferase
MDVALLEADAAGDRELIGRLTDLINEVYAVAEAGLWREGAKRTTPADLAAGIRAGELAVARRDGRLAGCLRLYDVSADTGGFGILVAAPDQRGTGVGRALVAFAERHSRERGRQALQLELLVPRAWAHPSKEFLKDWYGRLGYELIATRDFAEAYPQVAPLLATPCELQVREKRLVIDG